MVFYTRLKANDRFETGVFYFYSEKHRGFFRR